MPAKLKLPFKGSRLSNLRERSGLTRGDLATRCAKAGRPVTQQHIRRCELGESVPSAPLLKAFADALGVEVDALLEPSKTAAAS